MNIFYFIFIFTVEIHGKSFCRCFSGDGEGCGAM